VGAEPNFYDNNGPEAELLAAILTKGLKLPPDHVYLTALLKCPPQPNESQADRAEAASACLAETRRELARLAPKIVLALGEAAGAGLTGRDGEPLGLLRTRTFTRPDLPGAWLRVTFGLDQMLEAPEIKRAAWRDDFLKIKKFLDKPPCPTTAD
jgi:uracil-DNA glycosylase family 4